MRSEAEFREFFRAELLPELRKFERRRAEVARSLLRKDVIAALLLGLAAAAYLRRIEPVLIGLGWAVYRYAAAAGEFRREFKSAVVSRVIRFCDPGFAYLAEGHIPRSRVEQSCLFENAFDELSGEDQVEGRVGATRFRFSEITLRKKSSGKNRNRITVFRGLFFVADANKSFQGRTILLPDTAERLLGSLGRGLQALSRAGGGKPIALEDPEFEKQFVVYATDETEARYLLSPALMQRILRFRESAGAPVRMAFVDDCVHVALPLPENFFEPGNGPTLIDDGAVKAWIRQLEFVTGIVEDLDLNTRIWSKAVAPAVDGAGPEL